MTQVRLINKPARTFNNFMDDFLTKTSSLPGNQLLTHNGKQSAPVNIRLSGNEYILELVAPGFEKHDFTISIDKDILTIACERKKKTENELETTIRQEYTYLSFSRSFTIDEQIDASKIVAKYVNGVLTLNFQRKVSVKEAAKKINIQ